MQFEVRAIDANAAVLTVLVDAPNQARALDVATERGLRPLSATAKGSQSGWQFLRKKNDFHLGQFCQELLILLNAGLSLVEAIEALQEKEIKPQRREILAAIVGQMYQGNSFASALELHPTVFPALFVATVKASERTGDLADAMAKYSAYQEQRDVVRNKIVSASIYPVILIIAGLLVIGFLLGYVVPRFANIFEDRGTDLPFLSRLLIDWGKLANTYGSWLLGGIITLLVVLVFWLRRDSSQNAVIDLLERIPTIHHHLRLFRLARFYRSLGMLLRGGMPVIFSIDLVADLLPKSMRSALLQARQKVQEGVAISQAMDSVGLTSPVSARMLRVGEQSGQMGEMMEKIAHFYDAEVSQWIDWFLRLFEPLLMAFIGVAIGFIVVAMYFPIFELASSIQ
jgi:general secretion pathway protein F